MSAEVQPVQRKGQLPYLSPLVRSNGLDYLVDVVDRLATDPGVLPDARALKYAVLHLQAATEVFLKARLQRDHWTLVFKKPETASRTAFDSGKIESSCSTEEAFTRLTRITGLALPDKALEAVKGLAKVRNALQHYGLTASAHSVESHAAEVLNFLLPFIADHLLPDLEDEQRAEAERSLVLVRGRVQRIDAYLTKRRNELRIELKDVQDRTVSCPECEQLALVLGDSRPGCRFCLKTWDDPGVAAEEYAWQRYGLDPCLPGADEAGEAIYCPDCEHEAMTIAVTAAQPKAPAYLCFSCATVFADEDLTACEGWCARFQRTGSDPFCAECAPRALARF